MAAFYQAFTEPKDNTTKQTYYPGRQKLVNIEVMLTPTNLLILEEI